MFAALRFTAALLPAVLFIRRPAVPWRNLAAYGLLIGVGQFGILFIAMNGQITPALASLVVQTQVFFTVALAAYQNGERVRPFQFVALSITTMGLVLIMAHTDASTTPLGLALVLLAALSWAFGNMVIRSTPDADMLGYVVWASIFSIPPLLAASFLFDGWPAIRDGIAHADAATWGAVVWQGWGNTLFGFAVWGWLLGRYPVAAIAPTSLLVPVFGFAASAIWLGEPLQAWKLEATALVLARPDRQFYMAEDRRGKTCTRGWRGGVTRRYGEAAASRRCIAIPALSDSAMRIARSLNRSAACGGHTSSAVSPNSFSQRTKCSSEISGMAACTGMGRPL